TSPIALGALRTEIDLLERELQNTLEITPQPEAMPHTWLNWHNSVIEKCHALEEIEERINEAMEHYRAAIALSKHRREAVLDAYGNKHKNLVIQSELARSLGLSGVHVPTPYGIPSGQINNFLNENAPELFTHWESLKELYSMYSSDRYASPFLAQEAVQAHLKAIDEGISQAFARAAEDPDRFFSLAGSREFQDWLKALEARDIYLMVRSTGAEDSKKSANAGGNASIAYVPATWEAFCVAAGDVLRSYFHTASLQNRLNANTNPFEEELHLAVTAQELIGEPLNGKIHSEEIPTSLVLFTNVPLYIDNESFRMMRISATYGHGEGVVGNQGIASDTFTVLISASNPQELYILSDVQEKPMRLAPVKNSATGKVTLVQVKNPPELSQKPSLSPEIIRKLYLWGVTGEKYFENAPTDMEIVVKNGIIYPVQARPIVRPSINASYIDQRKLAQLTKSPIEEKSTGLTLVSGTGATVTIQRPDELLIAERLEDAEKLFVKGKHKLIIVRTPEPVNSHPVVNFSAMGMPCLYFSSTTPIETMLLRLNAQHQLSICVQEATVMLWDCSKASIEHYTSKGFAVHPAKFALSLPLEKAPLRREGIVPFSTETEHEELLALRRATSQSEARRVLLALKRSDLLKSFANEISALEHEVEAKPHLFTNVSPILDAAKALQSEVTTSLAELSTLINSWDESRRLEWLSRVGTL
ncbi:MAG: hypothetical protein KDK40_05870, partial [Chlamydiia bacterium]|nr:hypothetical protein [Chlamydiia bacterium]